MSCSLMTPFDTLPIDQTIGVHTMAKVTLEEIRHLSVLTRLGMTDTEVELMRTHMSQILENIDVLNQVDTARIEPTAHSGNLVSVMREDVVTNPTSIDDLMANVPQLHGEHIRVRAVLE